MRVVIVDDEELSRRRIRRLLAVQPDIEVVAECADGDRAAAVVEELRPDVVFLDVQMPCRNGLQVARSLAGELPTIVFVTAYDEYAIQAFEVHACDYVLKPVTRARFQATLDRLRKRRTGSAQTSQQATARVGDRILLKSHGEIVLLPLEEIDWIEAVGNYIKVHAGKKQYFRKISLQSLEAHLPAGRFCRISRSAIVNVNRILSLTPASRGDLNVCLAGGTILKLNRNYRERLEGLSIV